MTLIVIVEFICFIVFAIGFIKLIINFFKKKSKKKPVLMMIGSFVLVIALTFLAAACFPEEMEASRIANEERSQQKEQEKAEKEKQKEEERQKKKEEQEAKKKAEEERKQQTEQAAAEEEKTQEEQKEKEEQEQAKEFTYSKMTVKYLRHEISENAAGDKVLIVYYDFTNNSKDNESFDYSFSDKCFQNGVELEGSMFHANDETKNSDKEIQPGTTLEVASAFMLGDSMDTVTLEIEPWGSWTNKKLMTLELELE